jgi:hypothetical protein
MVFNEIISVFINFRLQIKELESMKFLRLSVIAILLLATGAASPTFGQSDRGTIRGTVADPNGAVVPNAKVTVTGTETGETRETTTSDEGIYVFPELRAATYSITVEAPGFQRSTVTDFKVAVQVTHTLNLELTVGAVTNEVTVTAEAETLQADTPVRQTNVTERQVKELPLLVTSEAGGRTPLAFIFLDSNVNSAETSSGTNASQFRVSGGQSQGTEILIDGASTRRQQNGTFFTEVGPGPNAFQEFTISTNSYSAEFGNSSGGIVNFTLKSGNNEFHGEAYDLVRNEVFNANSLYNKARGLERNRDNQNNYGFNIGGPIIIPGFGEGTKPVYLLRDKAFFFFNYEGYRFRQGINTRVTVPTVRMRAGDFGELLTDPAVLRQFPNGIRIYNPRLRPNERTTPLPNNIVPAGLIDPLGLRILQFFPTPNRPGVFENLEVQAIRPNDSNQFTIKTDFNISDRQRLTVSYSRRENTRLAGDFPVFPEPITNINTWDQTFRSNLARIQHDFSITPTLLNHLNIGYSFFDVLNRNTTDPFNTSSLGFEVNDTQNITFPIIDFPGYGAGDVRRVTGLGSTFFTDRLRDGTFQISDFMTLIAGRHSLRFGGDVRISQFNVRQYLWGGGQFNFRHDQTSSDIDPDGGYPVASLITGATEFAFNSNTSIEPAYRQLSQSYFIQDDIKLTRKLTLNVGLRYDLPGLRYESKDRYRSFDPNVVNPELGRKGAIVGAGGQGGLQAEERTLARPDRTNIGPRIGAAYALNERTVVRAGIGLYYSPILLGTGGAQGELQTGTLGYNNRRVYTPDGRFATTYLSNFPTIPTVDPNSQFAGDLGLEGLFYFDPNYHSGRTLQYSVDVQRQLPYNFVVSAGYIGHRADRLRSNFQRLNALPLNALRLGLDILDAPLSRITAPGANDAAFAAAARTIAQSAGVTLPASNAAVYPGFNGTVAQALRPFPQYGNIYSILESQGESEYNALQLKLERRFAQGIQFGASYTYSRLITNASESLTGVSPQNGVLQNPFDISSLKTDSPTHSPQVFVTNFLIELPFGQGKRFLNRGGIIDKVFGGFQVSGIFRYQQGTPLVPFIPGPATNFLNIAGYNGNLRPNLTGQPILLDERIQVPGQVGLISAFNRGAFAAPPDFGGARLFVNGVLNPQYQAYYSDPTRFFGTAPAVITDVRSDPFFTEDMSILKKTRITETITFEIGAELFNLFNRVRYLPPNVDVGSGNFGYIGAVDAPRVIQLRGRIIF